MELVFRIIEILGILAFALSGAMVGLRAKMDLFGVTFLGLITTVGGGIIRDVILGNTPPMTFRDPTYALLALAVSLIVFLPFVRKSFTRVQQVFDTVLLVVDSLGLGIYTVTGIRTAYEAGFDSLFILVFSGVITAVGGGALRDVLADQPPYIFVKHIYAIASLTGALVCALSWGFIGDIWAMTLGAVTVFVLRLLAARFRWNLPRAE